MKKVLFYFCFFGIAAFLASIGVCLAIIINMVYKNHPDYFSVNIFVGILTAVCAVWLSLLLHESAHAVSYKLSGCKIRAFYIFPVCFVKENKKFKVTLAVNGLLGFGGIVIPELTPCRNEYDIRKIYRAFRRSLMAAPLFSAALGSVSLLLMIFVTDKINVNIRSAFFIFFGFCVLTAAYINITSLLSFAGLIGDYAAFHMLKSNQSYALIQFYNELMLQNTYVKSELRKEKYFYSIILRYVDEIYLNNDKCVLNSEICSLMDIIFYENIIMDAHESDETELKLLFKILDHDLKIIEDRLKFETYSKFFCHMLIFMCCHGQYDKAVLLWKKYSDMIPNNRNGRYCIAQSEALFGKETDECLNKKVYISSMDNIFSHFNNYYDDENKINLKLTNKPIQRN